jgi:thiol-disulfide isomerase/thioredoxin
VLASESDGSTQARQEGHSNHFRLLAEEGRSWSGKEPDVVFQNRGDGTFDEVGSLLGLDVRGDGRGAAAADLDGDGDEDLVLVNRNAPTVQVFRNDVPGQGAVLQVGLQSTGPTVGAQVTVRCGEHTALKQVSAGSGLLSQSGGPLTFGLGACETVDSLSVAWPGGTKEQVPGPISADSQVLVRRGEGVVARKGLRRRNWNRDRAGGSARPSAPQPTLAFDRLDGGTVTLGPDSAGVTLLNFWATWCSACKRERPALRALQERYGERVRFLAVSLDEANTGKPEATDLETYGAGFEHLRGTPADQQVYAELGGVNPGIAPLTAVLADGVIRHVQVGALEAESVTEALEAALGAPR